MIGIAFLGGGSKASYQVGSFMAFQKCKIKIDAIVGSSIGSLNAALIVSNDINKMQNLWNDTSLSELFKIDEEKIEKFLQKDLSLINSDLSITNIYKTMKNMGLDVSSFRALVRNNVDEQKVRESKIKYGLITLDVETKNIVSLNIEAIPQGELIDYIVLSSFLTSNLNEANCSSSVELLNRFECDTIYLVDNKGTKNVCSNVVQIAPNSNNKNNDLENNFWYGYYDTLKAIQKIDGIDYYFEKWASWKYKRINHRIDKDLYKTMSILMNADNDQQLVLKSFEYILRNEKYNNLKVYKHSDIIKIAKQKETDNIVYKYVRKLSLL